MMRTTSRMTRMTEWILVLSLAFPWPALGYGPIGGGAGFQSSRGEVREIEGEISDVKDRINDIKSDLDELDEEEDDEFGSVLPQISCDQQCRPERKSCSAEVFRALGVEPPSSDMQGGAACLSLYGAAGEDLAAIQSKSYACANMVRMCSEVQKNEKKKRLARNKKKLEKKLTTLKRDMKEAQKDQISALAACPTCQFSGMGGTIGGITPPREPNGWDYALGFTQALAPVGLGIMGMINYSNSLDAYSGMYGGYLNQCATVGVPCAPPGVGMGGFGGGFMMMPGMGMGMGGFPGGGFGPGFGMMPGMGMGGGLMIGGGLGFGGGFPGMMPGMGMGMGMMPGMGMGMGMMPGMGMGMGMMPGMGMGMGMMPGMGMGMGGGLMIGGGLGLGGGFPGMMPGGYFTGGYGYPVVAGMPMMGPAMIPIGYGPGFGMVPGVGGIGMMPGMGMGGIGGIGVGGIGGMGMMPGLGMTPGFGYPGMGMGGIGGIGMMPGMGMGPGMGMTPGFGMGGMYPGMGMGGMGGMGGYNSQYWMLIQASMQRQMMEAQRVQQAQRNLMIAQQQMMEAQMRMMGGFGGGMGGYPGMGGGMFP